MYCLQKSLSTCKRDVYSFLFREHWGKLHKKWLGIISILYFFLVKYKIIQIHVNGKWLKNDASF